MKRAKRMRRPRCRRLGRVAPSEHVAYAWSGRLRELPLSDFFALPITPIPPWFGMDLADALDETGYSDGVVG